MKKIITRLFILGALIALLPAGAAAQQLDARQRNAETVVADGLAQLPAATPAVFNEVMGELAATGSAGIEMIAGMLTPADKGKNATLEYALNGITAYATAPGNEALVRRCPQGTGSGDRTLRRQRQPRFPLLAAAALLRGGGRGMDTALSGRLLSVRLCDPCADLYARHRAGSARRGPQGGPCGRTETRAGLCFRRKADDAGRTPPAGMARRCRRPDGRTDLQCAGRLRFARFAQTAGRRSRRGRLRLG